MPRTKAPPTYRVRLELRSGQSFVLRLARVPVVGEEYQPEAGAPILRVNRVFHHAMVEGSDSVAATLIVSGLG